MCRNIRQLHHFEPPATPEEVRAAALQYVRKIGGSATPSQANRPAYDEAVEQIARATQQMLDSMVSRGAPRDRVVEAARAKARSAARFSGTR
ncbi:MAG: DUF2277 domain-containing protein [Ornithinimicrobium sp.]